MDLEQALNQLRNMNVDYELLRGDDGITDVLIVPQAIVISRQMVQDTVDKIPAGPVTNAKMPDARRSVGSFEPVPHPIPRGESEPVYPKRPKPATRRPNPVRMHPSDRIVYEIGFYAPFNWELHWDDPRHGLTTKEQAALLRKRRRAGRRRAVKRVGRGPGKFSAADRDHVAERCCVRCGEFIRNRREETCTDGHVCYLLGTRRPPPLITDNRSWCGNCGEFIDGRLDGCTSSMNGDHRPSARRMVQY